MAATKRGRKPKVVNAEESKGAAQLIAALKFVGAAQRKEGTPGQMHCVLYNGFATAFDGLLTIGHPIEADLNCVPNTLKLISALSKCGQQVSITQLESGKLSIKSEKFKALVECERFENMPYVGPDKIAATIDDRIKTGLELVSVLADEKGATPLVAGVLLQANTCGATNRHAMLEYYHGIDLPPGLLIPKLAIKAIVGTEKKMVGFGYTPGQCCTFFYEDGSYIKTQLFADSYPSFQQFYEGRKFNVWPLPEGFWDAVNAVSSFNEDDVVYFNDGVISSEPVADAGASYEVQGLPSNMAFSAEYLRMCKPGFKQVEFDTQAMRVFFFNDALRGIIMGRHRGAKQV